MLTRLAGVGRAAFPRRGYHNAAGVDWEPPTRPRAVPLRAGGLRRSMAARGPGGRGRRYMRASSALSSAIAPSMILIRSESHLCTFESASAAAISLHLALALA